MSKWLQWRKDRFLGKPVTDWFVDEDGTFYCDHGPMSSAQCRSLEEHQLEDRRAA
jgi:hypothetical protein